MQTKTCPVKIKAAGSAEGTDEGVFEAVVATWDLDSVGDKITKGAFADTLSQWKDSGNAIPVIWSHMSHDPNMHIGAVEEVEEREAGLWVKGRLDLDNPTAAQVYKLLKGRRVTQMSFAYDIEDGSPVEQKTNGEDSSYFELRKLKLYEVGPTLIGANQATDLLAVKAQTPAFDQTDVVEDKGQRSDLAEAALAELKLDSLRALLNVKSGRTLSKQNEDRVRQIATLAQELLDALPSTDEVHDPADDAKATPARPAVPDEPKSAASEKSLEAPAPATEDVPAQFGTASLRRRLDLELFELSVDSLTN